MESAVVKILIFCSGTVPECQCRVDRITAGVCENFLRFLIINYAGWREEAENASKPAAIDPAAGPSATNAARVIMDVARTTPYPAARRNGTSTAIIPKWRVATKFAVDSLDAMVGPQ